MINSKTPFQSLIIHNSPVEFLVAGPRGSRNGIIIRSDHLKLDLIGFAARDSREYKPSGHIPTSFNVLFPFIYRSGRKRNSVKSSSLRVVDHDRSFIRSHDERGSEYKFCWIGECSPSDRVEIEKVFNLYIIDILKGLEDGDNDIVEWSIAPVVLSCYQVELRRQRLRIRILTLSGVYFISALIYLFMVVGRFSR